MNDEIIKKISQLESRVTELEKKLSCPGTQFMENKSKQVSVKEFLLTRKIQNEVQKTLLIGFYLEKIMGYTSFNIDDLEKTYRLAKEPIPTNLNDKINKNISKGFLMETETKKENKKAWELTASGEKSIDNL